MLYNRTSKTNKLIQKRDQICGYPREEWEDRKLDEGSQKVQTLL